MTTCRTVWHPWGAVQHRGRENLRISQGLVMQKPQRIGELFGIPGMPCSCHICTTACLNCMAGKYIWPILQICVQAVANHAVCKHSSQLAELCGIPGMPYESGLRVSYTNLVWLYVVSEGSRTNLAMWCLASLGCRTNQVWGYRIWIWYDHMCGVWRVPYESGDVMFGIPGMPYESGLRVPYESGLTEGSVRARSEGTVRIRSDWGYRTNQVWGYRTNQFWGYRTNLAWLYLIAPVRQTPCFRLLQPN